MSSVSINAFLEPADWLHPQGGPRYMQLRRRIQQAIDSAILEDNDPLPSEREIAAITSLSRVTVRKAVAALVQDELVVQRQGSGSFVQAKKGERYEQSLSRLSSFTEDIRRRGMSVSSRVLEMGVFAPTSQEIFALGLETDEEVTRINRLRLADDKPLAIELASTSARILPDPTSVQSSFYDALDAVGCRPVRAVQRISAINLSEDYAELLGVPLNAAGLHIERVAYNESGRVVERTISIYRADIYDFVAELKVA